MTAVTGPQLLALRRLPAPGEPPAERPRHTHRLTIERLLGLGLIEEVEPGLYRRTAAGDALVRKAEALWAI